MAEARCRCWVVAPLPVVTNLARASRDVSTVDSAARCAAVRARAALIAPAGGRGLSCDRRFAGSWNMPIKPHARLCLDRVRACRAAACLLAGLAGVGAAAAALAEAGATDAGADVSAGAPYNLAEVVVTSRRREETLQDVPLAETVAQRRGARAAVGGAVPGCSAGRAQHARLQVRALRVGARDHHAWADRAFRPRSYTTPRWGCISTGCT